MTEMLTIVPAGAGSGKTFRIKSDLTKWVKDQLVGPERILAVTFTEAAAAELRGRIRASLLAEGMVEAALAVEQAYVSTIHGLGLRILSEHAFAAGASPQPRALAEAERDLLIRQAMAHATSLDAVKADLPRFGYRSSFVSNASLEDSFRGKILSTIDLLRGLGDSGNDPKLAETAVERLRDLYGEVARDPAPLETRLTAAIEALLSAFPNDLTTYAASDAARKAFAKDFKSMKLALRPGELRRDWRLWKTLSELRQSKRGAPTPDGYDDLSGEVIEAASDIVIHPGPLDDACAHLTALVHGAQEVMSKYAEMKREAGVIDYGPREVPSKTFLDLVSMAARQLGAGKYPAKELWVNIEKCCSVDIIYRDDSGRTNLLFEYPFFSCPPEGISIFEHRRNVKVRVTINGAVFKWIFEVTEGA